MWHITSQSEYWLLSTNATDTNETQMFTGILPSTKIGPLKDPLQKLVKLCHKTGG